MAVFERGHSLVIGVSAYSDPDWNVPIVERDARDLYDTLIDPQIGAYDRGRVKLLRGAEASARRIDEELRFLAVQAEPGDTVFISFTGHGALDERGLYSLATSDTTFTTGGQIVRGSGYTMAQLAIALREIKAERLLLVINACSSGHLNALATNDGPQRAAIPEGDRKDLLKSGRGRALITASRPDELSHFHADDHNSYFGRALISGLQGVDVNPVSGYVGLFELYAAIYNQVQRAAEAAGYQQHPQINLVAGEGPFPVARYPRSSQGDPRLIQQTPPQSGDVQMVQIEIGEINLISADILIGGPNSQLNNVTLGDTAGRNIIKDTTINTSMGLPPSVYYESPPIIIPPFETPQPPRDPPPPTEIVEAPLIDFGNAQIGSVTFKGDVVRGDMTKNIFGRDEADEDKQLDPLRELPKLQQRVAVARNVDEDSRDEAAAKIGLALRALDRGDREKARQRIDEALLLLDAMNNVYINSATRKLRAVRQVIK